LRVLLCLEVNEKKRCCCFCCFVVVVVIIVVVHVVINLGGGGGGGGDFVGVGRGKIIKDKRNNELNRQEKRVKE
jgi:preprotein translocase subunit SecG